MSYVIKSTYPIDTLQLQKIPFLAVLCGLLLVVTALSTSQPHALAQGIPDWTLTVRPVNVNFGDTKIHIHIKGPFGAFRDDTIPNSQNPIDTFSMTGSGFPTGYRYQVCISSTAVGFFLPNCEFFTHGDGDETVSISPS